MNKYNLENLDAWITMQDFEKDKWDEVAINLYEEEEDDSMRRWRLFTCFLLDTDEEGCIA